MDTRSKNSEFVKRDGKKTALGFFAAFALILAADLTFLSQYPQFQKLASEKEPDILSESEFLHEVYQANIVLYKELRDSVDGRTLTGQDVYLLAEEEAVESAAEYYDFGDGTPLSYAGEALDVLLDDWSTSFSEGLGLTTRMHYEIVDHNSQYKITNTEHDLLLLGTEEAGGEADACYPYYIKMEFDENGLLAHVWVRGEDADTLLKSVQRVMRSRYLERSFYEQLSYSSFGDIKWEDSIYYGTDGHIRQMRIQVMNMPKNCTVCYAMTEAQLAEIKESSRPFLSAQPTGNYDNSGIRQLFYVLLAILGIAAMLLPLWKSYHLHERFLLPLHLESVIVLLVVSFLLFGELAAGMVKVTMTEYSAYSFSYAIRAALPGISRTMADGIVWTVNLIFLTVCYSLWFLLVTALAQAYVFGFRRYFRKRCLALRLFRAFRVSVRRKRMRFKRQMQHLDLEQDIDMPLLKLIAVQYLVLVLISLFWIFGAVLLLVYSVFLYTFFKKYLHFMQEKYACMLQTVRSVAGGNLQTEFSGDWGMFASLKGELSQIQTGFFRAVEEEVASQRMRTELITNVSHDLKTPLTAIITYISLLQEEHVTEAQQKEYLDVLERKALRLKVLIEDLFELSKASSGSVTIHPERMDVCQLLRQVYLEYEDRAKAAELTFRFDLPEQKVYWMLDGEKTYRIFDNLYANIIKYAMPGTRVYVRAVLQDAELQIELKNISGTELNVPVEKLTERFVRGDSARSSEGSGLGLAIAKTLTELQGGRMEISVDGDLFKVTLFFLLQ